MLISIITVSFNSRATIAQAVESVARQTYPHIEHIVVDGASTDGTVEIIADYANRGLISKWISEPDDGMYFAINKGIELATGDVIGCLHSDDYFAHRSVIERIVEGFKKDPYVSGVYGDLVYVDRSGEKIVRYWKAGEYTINSFRLGWMPPHPTLFLKREIFTDLGNYKTEYKIAADYEFILRIMWKGKIKFCYIPEVLIRMRIGGKSNKSVKNMLIKSGEDYKAMREHGLENPLLTLFLKNIRKAPQFVRKPRCNLS